MIEQYYGNDPLWQMSSHERAAFFNVAMRCQTDSILRENFTDMNPNWGYLEIGSYCGGSLLAVADLFDPENTYSLDVDHKPLGDIGKDVNRVLGKSEDTLPPLVDKFNNSDFNMVMALIDGDHEYDAVLKDVNNIIKYIPKPDTDTVILIHDSWYPPSRQAIIDSQVLQCPHVHFIDTDFCAGQYHPKHKAIGGMGLILMRAEPRTEEIKITQSQDLTFTRLVR